MKIEALNCPNCGAAVSIDATQCQYCHSRLKTMACPACLGLIFRGSQHCSLCGEKAVAPKVISKENIGNCPRCSAKFNLLQVNKVILRECRKCDGMWADRETFETICADRESQAAVLGLMVEHNATDNKNPVRYVPCPDCGQLMNRNNFANSSGVIIDICKYHGVWFDAEELPRIIEFIHTGGLDHARKKEKIHLDEQRRRLRDEQRKTALKESVFDEPARSWDANTSFGIREFVRFLFD